MLVLTRKVDEQIILTLPDGNTVTLVVTRIAGDKIRIGIDAPNTVNIRRSELGPYTPSTFLES